MSPSLTPNSRNLASTPKSLSLLANNLTCSSFSKSVESKYFLTLGPLTSYTPSLASLTVNFSTGGVNLYSTTSSVTGLSKSVISIVSSKSAIL